jgi:GGDEF domain-containing protein
MAHEAPRTTGGVPAAAAPAPDAAFARRISEELERAKRFDLGLSIVLIDLNHASTCDEPTVHRMVDAVRHELRGSDLLGILDDGRIAALLVHTDAAGMTSVVPRLRRRVADVSRTLGVDNPRFGRAAFSHEIRTASALVSEALRDLQAVR